MSELFDLNINYEEINKKYEKLSIPFKSLISNVDIKNLFTLGAIDENLDILKSSLYGENIFIFLDIYNKYCNLYEKYIEYNKMIIEFVSPNQLKDIQNKTWDNFFNELRVSYDVLNAEIHNLENPSVNKVEIENNIKDLVEFIIKNQDELIKYFIFSEKVLFEIKIKMFKVIYEDFKNQFSINSQNITSFLFDYKFDDNKFIQIILNILNKIIGINKDEIIKKIIKKYINKSFRTSMIFYTKTLDLLNIITSCVYKYINNRFNIEGKNYSIYGFLFYIINEKYILNFEEKKYLSYYLIYSYYKNCYIEIKKLIDNNKLKYFILPFINNYKKIEINKLIVSIHKNKSIKELNLSYFLRNSSNEEIKKLFSKLDKTKYERLYLCNNNLSDETFIKYICPFINKNKKLKELYVSFNKLTNLSCLHLFKILNTTFINKISINENKILFNILDAYKKFLFKNNYIKKIKVCNYTKKFIVYSVKRRNICKYEKFYWSLINNINIENDFSDLVTYENEIDKLIKGKNKKRNLQLKNNSSKRNKTNN